MTSTLSDIKNWILDIRDNIIRKFKKAQKEEVTVEEKPKYKGYCEFCKKRIPNPLDRFYCKYCKKWHCEKHRLPEDHKCKGKLISPKSTYREIYSKGKTTIISK